VAAIEREANVILVRDQKRLTDLKVEGSAKNPQALAAQIVEGIIATVQHLK
jgi:hypothetical protein